MSGRHKRPSALMVLAVVLSGLTAVLTLGGLNASRAASPPPPVRPAGTGCSGESSLIYSAGPQKVISHADVPVCVTGQVIVTFAGDDATGCRRKGLCDESGTETWEPQGSGDLGIETVEQNGRRSTGVTLVIGGFDAPVLSSVQQTEDDGSTMACADVAQNQGGFFTPTVHHGEVDVGFAAPQEAIFGTRCAGPLDHDIMAALPHRTLSLARLRRGQLTVDLSGSTPFAAGGFAGTVQSTLRLSFGRTEASPKQQSAPPDGQRERISTVQYQITQLHGAATAIVQTSPVPGICGALDACGLSGTILVAPLAGPGGSAVLTATASARRPDRDLLTALGVESGGDSRGISVGGGGEAATGGSVSADLRQNGTVCQDRVALGQTELVLRKQAGRLVVSLSPETSQAADPLRTRCPGPALGGHSLTSGSLPLSALRRPSFTVRLSGGHFRDGPYAVATHSSLVVSLRRGRVRTQIFEAVG